MYHVDLVKDIPQGGVVMLLERVQVASQAPSEHHRFLIKVGFTFNITIEHLWYNRDPGSEVLKAQFESVSSINDNPASWLGQSKESCHNA